MTETISSSVEPTQVSAKKKNRSMGLLLAVGLTGALVGGLAFWVLAGFFPALGQAPTENRDSDSGGSAEPLYWVAPMDPNFRRDGPGLSPMGMDLIPVYEEASTPGTVEISPGLANSLGVTLGKAEVLPFVKDIRAPAKVVANPAYQQQLTSRVDGWVQQQYVFRVGESISQGDPLFRLYSPELVGAQEELLSALRLNNQIGSKGLIKAAENRLRALGMSQTWISQLKSSGRLQEEVIIRAPQSGQLTSINIEPGQRISSQMPLLSIADFSQLWVEAEVYGQPVKDLAKGDRVLLNGQQGNQKAAHLDAVYPLLDQQGTAKVRVQLSGTEASDWLPGEWLEMQIQPQYSPSLQIPKTALIDDGQQPRVVLALSDPASIAEAATEALAFKSVAVQTGRSNDQRIEILAGLEAGDRVVTSGQFMLDSESSVTSDLLRFYPQELVQQGKIGVTQERVHLQATMTDTGIRDGRIHLAHQGIPEWQWPAMQQDYHLALPASEVQFAAGDSLRIELVALDDGDYCVVKVGPPGDNQAPPEPLMDHSGMDHSGMDHSGMDHSGMDHSGMDHSGMDHSGMDHSGMDHSGMDHSGMDHSGMDHSGMDHSGMDHSGMDHSGMDHSQHSMGGQE